MSRRRRRNSRRKSSASSKRERLSIIQVEVEDCVSPFVFHKQSKSNSVSNKDDITEKGETDSLRKETVESGAEEGEERYDDIPSKEKKFKPHHSRDSFQSATTLSFSKPNEKENKGVQIVTSVTINDLKDSSPKIIIQQFRQARSEEAINATAGPTTTKVRCVGSSVQFEIQEIIQPDNCGVKTTFVLQNELEGTSEAPLESGGKKKLFTLGDVTFEQCCSSKQTGAHQNAVMETNDGTDEQGNSVRNTCCGQSACRKSCCENNMDHSLADRSLSSTSSIELWPEEKKKKKKMRPIQHSLSSEAFWDIPPPSEFADVRCNVLEDLTEDMASFQLGGRGSPVEQEAGFSPTLYNRVNPGSGCPYPLDREEEEEEEEEEENDNFLSPFFDRLSECDSYDPAFVRPPSSNVSRSVFTENFVHSHEKKTWLRNHSMGTVERDAATSYLVMPSKRRQTFPGGSEGPSAFPEGLLSNRDSFSSGTISPFVMESLPVQAERLGRFYHGRMDEDWSTQGSFITRLFTGDTAADEEEDHMEREQCDSFCSIQLEEGHTERDQRDSFCSIQLEEGHTERDQCDLFCSIQLEEDHMEREQHHSFCSIQLEEGHTERDQHDSFCLTQLEEGSGDGLPETEQYQDLSTHLPPEDLRCLQMDFGEAPYDEDLIEDAEGQVEQSEVWESGFEEEMGEVFDEPTSGNDREPSTEEEGFFLGGNLLIQVIPPSRAGSEEHIIQSPSPTGKPDQNKARSDCTAPGCTQTPVQDGGPVSDPIRRRQGSVTTVIVGTPEQRFLQTDKPSSASQTTVTRVPDTISDSVTPGTEEVVSPPGGSGDDVLVGVAATEPLQSLPDQTSVTDRTLTHSQNTEPGAEAQMDGPGKSAEFSGLASTGPSSLTNESSDLETEGEHRPKLYQTDSTETNSMSKSAQSVKESLKPPSSDSVFKEGESGKDSWAKRRKLFKDSKQWSSAAGSSLNSEITEESVSEEVVDTRHIETKGFYTETFHSAKWIYRGDDVSPNDSPPTLSSRPRTVAVRERTVKICKGMGDYPWGFRIQFSKPIVVTEVDTNGAAEEAGLLVGDTVLAVNGTDVTSVSHSEAAELARQGPGILTLTIGSDIGRSPNTPRPACRGYLHKRTQSGLIKGWRKRWFVLRHDCCLYYYRHKRDEGRRRALSAVKLEGAEIAVDTSLGKPFVFKCCPLVASRVFLLSATSNQEMKKWLEAMDRAVHPITEQHVWVDVTRHNANLPPLAVKNPECLGLLYQIDRSKDTWVQHYCILKDACLYFYAGIRSTHALAGIYLHGYIVREQPMGSKKSTIELKCPSDEFTSFHLSAENTMENKRWIAAIKASINKWMPFHQVIQDYMNRPPEETRM